MKLLKGLSLFFSLFIFSFVSLGLCIFNSPGPKRRKALVHWMHQFSQRLIQVLDVHFWLDFRSAQEPSHGTLFLANHVSYLDILILASRYPAVFVTSIEVKNSFFLGWLARLSGAYFVERRNRTTLKQDIKEIRKILDSGLNVILFPEGTTSDGSTILPFKSPLLEAIVNTNIEVRPLCLNYRWCDGEAVSAQHRDTLFYFGKMNLWKQIGLLLGVSEILAEVIVLPALESYAKSCRTLAARASREFIASVFMPIPIQKDFYVA